MNVVEAITLVLILATGLAAATMLLAGWLDWHPVANIKNMWRWWTVRLQTVSALLTGWLFFDPTALLYVFNLLPNHVRSTLPGGLAQVISVVGGFIFLLSILTIIARGVDQPKARK